MNLTITRFIKLKNLLEAGKKTAEMTSAGAKPEFKRSTSKFKGNS